MKKTILILILVASCYNVMAQNDRLQAFDGSFQLSMGMRERSDATIKIEAGLSGRRIPLSFLVGGHYMEFNNDASKLGYKLNSAWGYNATLMLRVYPIDITYRSIDWNIYTTALKDKNLFLEYGLKTGILINDRSRIYINAGIMSNDKYASFTGGVTFSLLFFNGYSAY
jgi:hypothetical protein